MEYILVAIGCFILGIIYNNGGKQNRLDTEIMSNLKLGKRVIICIDSDATIFEMVGNRIRITKAETSFILEESVDLPIGAQDELESNTLDDSRSDQSGNYNETGVGH